MPSNRYELKSEDLWQQYQAKEFDHSKYLELLGKIRTDEIAKYKPEYAIPHCQDKNRPILRVNSARQQMDVHHER